MTLPGSGKIWGINGPILTVHTGSQFCLGERVAARGLPGEIISLSPGVAVVQSFESTAGLRPGDEVLGLGAPIAVRLRPGIVGNIFDGIMRPLGGDSPEEFYVKMLVKPGQTIAPGDVFAAVQETPVIIFKAMAPPGVAGLVKAAAPDGRYNADAALVTLACGRELSLTQTWPIRSPRPVAARLPATQMLTTGQRVIDSLFPVAKGGTAAIPGGFGTGKTMTQHQLAKYCDADLIIYIGCGERGNEMTEVLEDFSRLVDPRSGQPLLARTVLVANTSDMPVAAREASIYTGVTLAECYRDMGYHVALFADSTSRWAEALREISGRLGEIPAEEGYPAYLATRLAAFYGRAGHVKNLNGSEGSITIIGAVSPQGADFTEPVTQHTKRFVRTFWALDKRLAYARHYPAIDWMQSYSIGCQLHPAARRLLAVLHEENSLLEVAKLMGQDGLTTLQKQLLDAARRIREGFLQQNAYDVADTYTPVAVQVEMMERLLKPLEVSFLRGDKV